MYLPIKCHMKGMSIRALAKVTGAYDRHRSLPLCRGVGCIFFEMTCGRPMFPGSTVEEQLMLIWKVRGSIVHTHCSFVPILNVGQNLYLGHPVY